MRSDLPPLFALMLATLPLVQVGTIRGPFRLILPDLLAVTITAVLLWQGRPLVRALTRSPRVAAAALAVVFLCGISAAASLLSLVWITPRNFQQWAGYEETLHWIGTPLQRTVLENVRLVQCALALIVTLALLDTPGRVRAAIKWYAAGATVAALYGVYTWYEMVTGAGLPLLPGTFEYLHLKRIAATFPEPVAYGGFALTGLALTLWLVEHEDGDRSWAVALGVQLFAALASLSTLLILGVVLLWVASLGRRHLRIVGAVGVAGALAIVLVLAAVPTAFVLRAIDKPLTVPSWLDRTTAWRAAAAMALTYPALGVGAGLYAYNQAPFLPPDVPTRHAGGRINSVGLEIFAESGAAGLVACAVLLAAASLGSARGSHGWAGLRGVAVLAVLGAGYYTSRYAFLWVFTAILIASGTGAPEVRREAEAETCAC